MFLNSTISFVAAFIFTTLIHESGHFVAHLLAGSHPALYHNYVQASDADLSLSARVAVALAGPFASLMQGIIAGFIGTKRRGNSAVDLLLIWFALLGFINSFGYLMMTPLSTVGDTGKAAELLDVGYVYRVIIALVGAAMVFPIIVRIGKNFSKVIPASADSQSRVRYIYRVMFFPILIGSTVNTLLALPVPAVLSVIYPATSSWAIMSSFGAIKKASHENTKQSGLEKTIHVGLVSLLVAGVVVNRFLTQGVGG